MRAAVAMGIDERDPLSKLKLEDGWPEPEPAPGQVRIKLAATTVNMHDLWTLCGVGIAVLVLLLGGLLAKLTAKGHPQPA